jgi:hypothetical protein
MHILPFTRMIAQRGVGDCAVVALAMLTHQTYEEVLTVATALRRFPHRRGLYVKDIIAIAKQLGMPLRRHRRYDLEHMMGLLVVSCRANRVAPQHIVFVRWGLIFDDGDVWEPDAYLAHYQATGISMLVADHDAP